VTLRAAELVAFAPTTDLARARAFYEGVLGLSVIEDDDFAVAFDAHGTMLRVTAVRELVPAPYTIVGWSVPDIAAAMDALDVSFERYAAMDQDERGIWTVPGGARVAWFKDPDGNTLALSQLPTSGGQAGAPSRRS
jgi:catechol 2,3-dioxygenase-like lactoylglutathione lyase family enzyme